MFLDFLFLHFILSYYSNIDSSFVKEKGEKNLLNLDYFKGYAK